MNWLFKAEQKFGRFAIQGLIKYVLILVAAGGFIGIAFPQFYFQWLMLDFSRIAEGQIWRLITFLLYPSIGSGTSIVNILFFAIMIYLYYMIGNTLENVWGSFRFNLYIFVGLILTIVANLVFFLVTGSSIFIHISEQSASYSYATFEQIFNAMFLTFAFMFPETQFLLFFVVPIKAKWLGFLYLAMEAFEIVNDVIVGDYLSVLLITAALINFLIFYLIGRSPARSFYQTGGSRTVKSKVRKKKVKRPEPPKDGPRHRCAICGRTELDAPNLEFRYCSKCEGNYEYCSDHLFTHEHVKKRM